MNPQNPVKAQKPISKPIVATGIASTVVIGSGAFVLSFSALTDLAVRAGINHSIAWMWPLIVDGMIVAATVAIVALAGRQGKEQFYPWVLLFFGAVVSTAANSIHAILAVRAENGNVPVIVSALVAAMPPVVLLAITHLTVLLVQYARNSAELENAALESAAQEQAALEPASIEAAGLAGADTGALATVGSGAGASGVAATGGAATGAAVPGAAGAGAAGAETVGLDTTGLELVLDASDDQTPATGSVAAVKPKAAPKRKPRKAPATTTASKSAAASSTASSTAASTAPASATAGGSTAAAGTVSTSSAGAKSTVSKAPVSKSAVSKTAASNRPLVPGLSSVTSGSPLLRGPSTAELKAIMDTAPGAPAAAFAAPSVAVVAEPKSAPAASAAGSGNTAAGNTGSGNTGSDASAAGTSPSDPEDSKELATAQA